MFSLFQNKNKQVLEAVTKYQTNKAYRFPYKTKDIERAKEWYICNNVRPDLLLILEMRRIKSQLSTNVSSEFI